MRNTIVASTVVPLLAPLLMVGLTGFVGCKSAPKMPWSRTAATSDVESAAIAHSAPALPADIAKQAEALAASAPSIDLKAPQISTAPAYTPPKASLATTPTLPTTSAAALMASQGSGAKASPSAYPTTGASPYTTTPKPTVAVATPSVPPAYQSADKSANLGSVNLPYNSSAVPPAKTIASAAPVAKPAASVDRYAATTAPALSGATVPPVKTAAVPDFSGSSRYGRYGIGRTATTAPATSVAPPAKVNLAAAAPVAPSKTPAYEAPATASPAATPAATPVASPANVSGDRYAATSVTPTKPTSSSPGVTTPASVPALTMPASTSPVVASASVYRPGGTTSYGGPATGQPVAAIATRPKPAIEQVPSVTTPGTASESLQAPRYR